MARLRPSDAYEYDDPWPQGREKFSRRKRVTQSGDDESRGRKPHRRRRRPNKEEGQGRFDAAR